MIDRDFLKTLSDDDKRELINLIEGMPQELNSLVKISLNEPFMDPSLFKVKERKLNIYSTIKKYLNKDSVVEIDNPAGSYYQSEYCKVLFLINNSKYPYEVKRRLSLIMDMPSYDIDSIIEIELKLSNLLYDFKTNQYIEDIASLINENILLYKFRVYDFYTYLSLIESGVDITRDSCDYMYKLNCCINQAMKKEESFSHANDLSVLIYLYLKEFGLEKVVNKHGLFHRFQLGLMNENKSNKYIEDILDNINTLSNDNSSVLDASSRIINSNEYNNTIGGLIKGTELKYIDDNDKTININGFTFMTKYKDVFENLTDENMIQIRFLTEDEILNYYQNATKKYSITFTLSDNDIGHLNRKNDIYFATSYDSYSHEMKYIGYYDGNYYLFFKNLMVPNSIFGISLSSFGLNRNILEIKENKTFFYKYISTI